MNFKQQHFTLLSKYDGLTLGVTTCIPEHPIGILQLVHGMAEHRRRYLPIMEYFANQGYVVIIHDHRGHGDSIKSPDDLGYFYQNGQTAIIEDVFQITQYIKAEFPNLPLTLLGHSMGSLVVRCYAKKYDNEIDGLIVCGSPSKQLGARLGKPIAKLLKLFKGDKYRSEFVNHASFAKHNQRFLAEHDPNSWVVSDPAVRALYSSDPKSGFTFTLNGFETLFGLMNSTYSKFGWHVYNPELPIIFLAGEDDPCIISQKDFHAAVNFMRQRGYHHVSGKLYPAMRHEILNETHKALVWSDILTWMQQNVK